MRFFKFSQVFLSAFIYNVSMKIFAERLKELRLEKEISQRKLAAQTTISPTAIRQWENGSCSPNAEAVVILAEFFNISADYLLGLEN